MGAQPQAFTLAFSLPKADEALARRIQRRPVRAGRALRLRADRRRHDGRPVESVHHRVRQRAAASGAAPRRRATGRRHLDLRHARRRARRTRRAARRVVRRCQRRCDVSSRPRTSGTARRARPCAARHRACGARPVGRPCRRSAAHSRSARTCAPRSMPTPCRVPPRCAASHPRSSDAARSPAATITNCASPRRPPRAPRSKQPDCKVGVPVTPHRYNKRSPDGARAPGDRLARCRRRAAHSDVARLRSLSCRLIPRSAPPTISSAARRPRRPDRARHGLSRAALPRASCCRIRCTFCRWASAAACRRWRRARSARSFAWASFAVLSRYLTVIEWGVLIGVGFRRRHRDLRLYREEARHRRSVAGRVG